MAIKCDGLQCKFFDPRTHSNRLMNHLNAGSWKQKSDALAFQPNYPTFCSTWRISCVKSHSFPMLRPTQNCKLLIAYNFIKNIFFLIDTDSSYSLISASKRERKISPDPTVLYSATSNVIQKYGKQN